MLEGMKISNVLDALFPISRFNQGGANKIFDEIKKKGYGIVVKNNNPECILISPEKYREIMDTIEDYHLLQITTERMASDKNNDVVSMEEIMKKYNISQEDLDEIEVEIE